MSVSESYTSVIGESRGVLQEVSGFRDVPGPFRCVTDAIQRVSGDFRGNQDRFRG